MRMSRFTLSSLSNIRSATRSIQSRAQVKARTLIAGGLLATSIAAAALFPAGVPAQAAPAHQIAATPFLTLPFVPNSRMSILSGWYYSGGGGFHGGIDFINGSVNSIGSWRTFPVIASADGEACGNCTTRQGNAEWLKHDVNGATYNTYYA